MRPTSKYVNVLVIKQHFAMRTKEIMLRTQIKMVAKQPVMIVDCCKTQGTVGERS